MTQGPDPRAQVRGYMALVLDMVRIDPERRPSAAMRRWYEDLAASIGVAPATPATNRDLLTAVLRLSEALHGPSGAPADAPARAEVAA